MPFKFKYFILFFLLLFLKFQGNSQAQNAKVNNDTIVVDSSKLHSPKIATIMSTCLPGLGQVYNKKYWKVPIIYAGFAAAGYGIVYYGENYKKYHNAYIYRIDGDSTTIDKFPSILTENLIVYKDFYRRNRDLCYIVGVLWYVINILDASVDAHLFYFNINEDLSLNVKPTNVPLYYKNKNSSLPGLSLSFNIGKNYSNKYNKLKSYL